MHLTADQLAALRREYAVHGIRRNEMDPDPIRQFQKWLSEALQQQVPEPNGMTISTVDATGQPWSRTVLLKICNEQGFTFFTNYDSAKGCQLEANPKCALTFWWAAIERQVNVTGVVSKTSREQSERYFHSRPTGSQLGAWTSQQSAQIASREQLEQQFEEVRARFGESVPLPPNWGGYCVRPETIEFWQGRASRLHDRLRYVRQRDDSWQIERLSP